EPAVALHEPAVAPPAPPSAFAPADSSPLELLAAGALEQPRPRPPDLATIIPPTADPSVNATPVFAESWGGDAPANPFSDVSDGAIEYFVEWSLEQSIGPRARPQAQFSDVPMALPGNTGSHALFDPATPGRRLALFGAIFAAGALAGAGVVALVERSPAGAQKPVAAAAAPLPAVVAQPP